MRFQAMMRTRPIQFFLPTPTHFAIDSYTKKLPKSRIWAHLSDILCLRGWFEVGSSQTPTIPKTDTTKTIVAPSKMIQEPHMGTQIRARNHAVNLGPKF